MRVKGISITKPVFYIYVHCFLKVAFHKTNKQTLLEYKVFKICSAVKSRSLFFVNETFLRANDN